MASSFTWLDYSEQDKRKMLEVVSAFSEKRTQDELGIGGVSYAFSEMLFPGTSTIQTRARYFLFIPWIYRDLVRRRISAQKFAREARQQEIELINALAASADTVGVIGKRARHTLKRLPSSIYWAGLNAWGIRLFPGSQEEFHQSIEEFSISRKLHSDDGDRIDRIGLQDWDRSLPAPPPNFPNQTSFQLTIEESAYLRDRILLRHPDSLLAFLVSQGTPNQAVNFAWEHPQFAEFSPQIQRQLLHARRFSDMMLGAALLYNLMLAEEKRLSDLSRYELRLQDWANWIHDRHSEFQTWDRDDFWRTISDNGAIVGLQTRTFITQWIELALQPNLAQLIVHDETARLRIRHREKLLKGRQARLGNPRALELWQGESGMAQLDYRWSIVQRIVSDILKGFYPEDENAAS